MGMSPNFILFPIFYYVQFYLMFNVFFFLINKTKITNKQTKIQISSINAHLILLVFRDKFSSFGRIFNVNLTRKRHKH